MKLSEAIRLGSMLGPQAYGVLQREVSTRKWLMGLIGPLVKTTEYCAMGAAQAASGDETETRIADGTVALVSRDGTARVLAVGECYTLLKSAREWRETMSARSECPSCKLFDDVALLIPHLNDNHRWTRERIAEFVETIERQIANEPVDGVTSRGAVRQENSTNEHVLVMDRARR